MMDIENVIDIKNMGNIEDFIDEINKKIKVTIKKIEKKCKEQEYELKKNNELLILELKDLILSYNVRTYKSVSLV